MTKKVSATFIFDNEKVKKHFLIWLCEMGEQQYWEWMEVQEQKERGNITAVDFDYWNGTKDGDKFGSADIITTSGRTTDED